MENSLFANTLPSRHRASLLLRSVFIALAAVFFLGIARGVQAAPQLSALPGDELRKEYQPGKKYTLRLRYVDPSGDTLRKSNAVFVDESDAGTVRTPATDITGDPKTGAVISWEINGFAGGGHRAYFDVKALTDTARYPTDPAERYEFAVATIGTKLLILAIGVVVSLVGIPLVVYLMARSINRKGNPSTSARIALLIGVLMSCGLFVYLFLGTYGWLTLLIFLVGVIAAFPLLLSRR
jgi:hypothetical protein